MNLISLYYFNELAKNLHMTNTAENLFISQQTLSNHINRLEKYYQTKLFYRKPTLKLTYSGEILFNFSNEILKKEQNIKDIFSDIESNQRGIIRFGSSTARGLVCLPNLMSQFYEKYPKVEFRFTDLLSNELELLINSGDLDLALVLLDKNDINLTYKNTFYDQVYLCVPDELLTKYYGSDSISIKEKSVSGANTKNFEKIPFSMLSNRLCSTIQKCFLSENCSPNIRFSSSFSQILTSLCNQGLSACFITKMNLVNIVNDFKNKINIFPIKYKDEYLYQKLAIIHSKDKFLPNYSIFFLELLD